MDLDIVVLEEESSFHKVFRRLHFGPENVFSKFLSEKSYLDARLTSMDSEAVFDAHRVVLAGVSPFLHKQFLKHPDPKTVVRLPVTKKCLNQILTLVYDGHLALTSSQDFDDLCYALRGLNLKLGPSIDKDVYDTADVKCPELTAVKPDPEPDTTHSTPPNELTSSNASTPERSVRFLFNILNFH